MQSCARAALYRDDGRGSTIGRTPATDADYEIAAREALAAYGEGRLSAAETDARLAAIYAAQTRDELMALADRVGSDPARAPAGAPIGIVMMMLLGGACLAAALSAPGATWASLLMGVAAVTSGAFGLVDAAHRRTARHYDDMVGRYDH